MMIRQVTSWFRNRQQREDITASLEYLLINELNCESGQRNGAVSNEQLRKVFLNLMRRAKPTIFCDIGAHDGQASLTVRGTLPACKIYAFEANPEIYKRYHASLIEKGVHYINLAISNRAGSATLFVPRTLSKAYVEGRVVDASIVESENTGKASLLLRNENATYAEFKVRTALLDAFFQEQNVAVKEQLFALWIDVEGAAARVLAGADAVLKRTSLIFIELEGFEFWKGELRSPGVCQFLIRRGFIPIARDYEYSDKQYNVLFLSSKYVNLVYEDLFSLSSDLKMLRHSPAYVEPVTGRPSHPVLSLAGQTGRKKGFPSVGSFLQSQIPIFIPTFNNLTYLRMMLDQLSRFGLQNIIVVDNCSDYPPFLSYLQSLGEQITIIYQPENRRPRHIFQDENTYRSLPEYFCVTDPDLEFNPKLPSDFVARLIHLTEVHSIGKAGFGLDVSEPGKMRQKDFKIGEKTYKIWEWEAQFWLDPLPSDSSGNSVYKAAIDTTFAVYNKKFFRPVSFFDAIRVAGDFTCRHLPWYPDTRLPPDEEAHYRKTSKFSFYLGE